VSEVETEFLLISEAVGRLEAGMFGQITRAEPVEKLKVMKPRLSVGLGVQKEKAAQVLLAAILKGDLSVRVFAPSTGDAARCPLAVPSAVLQLTPKVRGGLPDHLVRQPVSLLRERLMTPDVFAALSVSALYLQETEFAAWYKKRKGLRRWPSQRTSGKSRIGRPTEQTEPLLNLIRALVAEGKWCASDGIAKLAKLLAAKGAPLRNTLRRAVDQLFIETGDPQYRVIPRKRAKTVTNSNLVQNSFAPSLLVVR
jgi:hypothetical protein